MSVEALAQVVPPPADVALEVGDEQAWREKEHLLGTALPADYKAYIDLYGTGHFGLKNITFLWPLNPFSQNLDLIAFGRSILEVYEECRLTTPVECPFETYPMPGGLLPWGRTDNGDSLFWLTENEPDQWPTVVYDDKYLEYERYSLTMSEFLTEWVTGRITSNIFPDFAELLSFFPRPASK